MDILGMVAGQELVRMYSAATPDCDQCDGLVRCIGGGTAPKFAYQCVKCGNAWQQIKPMDVPTLGLQKTPISRNSRGKYTCKHCGQLKKGHICTMKPSVPMKTARVFKTSRTFESVRKNKPQRCTNCHQLGHKKATCAFPAVSE